MKPWICADCGVEYQWFQPDQRHGVKLCEACVGQRPDGPSTTAARIPIVLLMMVMFLAGMFFHKWVFCG